MAKKYKSIEAFHEAQSAQDRKICRTLRRQIDAALPEAESRIWHGHPVWFLDENPVVGYSKLKDCIRLMFWSGADFEEERLQPGTGKFKDASVRYTKESEIDNADLSRWLSKARTIQWDYRNVAKRKGRLVRVATA